MTRTDPTTPSPRARFRKGAEAPYEDPSRPVEERVEDLLGRMTLEEKAGLMFHSQALMGPGGEFVEDPEQVQWGRPMRETIEQRHLNHFNLVGGAEPEEIAAWHNRVQEVALGTRLGIPVTLSSDPRHHFTENWATSAVAIGFAQFPETTGLAAIGDEETVRAFADVVRREYLAVGIRVALHPQIDLATEPRWSRISGTFGENADLTGRLVAAYIKGLQGETLGSHSVAAMTKHFPGGGPQKDGEDPHLSYGREQVYPGGMFDYHLAPFLKALEAGTSQMMPYYGMPVDTEMEAVGFGFNKGVITGLLREKLGFDGIVCTDWGLVTDNDLVSARAWGVEHLTPSERTLKVIEAGCDQFGGEACPELVVELVHAGKVSEERVDVSVRRLLREKFVLGLFENPFVDVDAAASVVGTAEAVLAGRLAQSRSVTLLKNADAVLPLAEGTRVYVEGVDPETAAGYGTVVAGPEEADVAILRLSAPFEKRTGPISQYFHAGRLAFDADELAPVLAMCAKVPTVVDIYLDRPAVLPEIAEASAALVGNYGSGDVPLLDVLFGRQAPEGSLPFPLPRSMADVERQRSDVPSDGRDPVFAFGHGLAYRPREGGAASS
ncbi:glycoside hydrolase family 3 C-terminal domain-containing protein [Streptomyces sp. NBC_01485]|uniref:glycoside hydrolase family 3 protein n=1 Tax=Streptomyces sp. NBC_01485 TaxID=2903884 RepID=UPI002E318949|nr:glycoside hydrolase family 3 N-terminal domain-containing protein [Streptomyces sp. NBC_01485]